jgi:hypothetical protein
MTTIFCPHCRLEQPVDHAYCARCGSDLPAHLLGERPAKKVRFFAGVKVQDEDLDIGYLRVSCYLKEHRIDSGGEIATYTGRHVRFSVWDGERARCVLSLPEHEARDLAAFIAEQMEELQQL